MPVGKPTDDGEITLGSRHYRGSATLGALANWNCPACGMKNEGRKPEQGCLHCGAGDPGKSQAGKPTAPTPARRPGDNIRDSDPVGAAIADALMQPSPPWTGFPKSATAPCVRVLRLIEYLINPGEDADTTLRRSLVGRMDFPWGTLTATMVDSCDARQEDLLGLARRQPGVWLGNQEVMTMAKQPSKGQPALAPAAVPRGPAVPEARKEPVMELPPMPSTGPSFGEEEAKFAAFIAETYSLRLAHTLALALSQIAPELAANMEPLKFLSDQECLALANALMQRIPDDWDPQPPPAPAADESDAPPQTLGDA